ncbi:hypothetical protein L9F63_014007, partial [Diploptera punctata]
LQERLFLPLRVIQGRGHFQGLGPASAEFIIVFHSKYSEQSVRNFYIPSKYTLS